MSPPAASTARDRLRIAIQKSGRLAEPARALLASCGLSWRESRDRLFCYGETLPIDLLLVRDDDIPGLIADGVCDLGIVGRNVLRRAGRRARSATGAQPAFREWRALGFGALPAGAGGARGVGLAGRRAAGRQAHRHQLPGAAVAVAGGAGHRGRSGGAVRLGGDRAAAGPGRRDLRPGLQRRDAGGQPAQAGRDACWKAKRCSPVRRAEFDDVRAELAELLLRRLDGALRMPPQQAAAVPGAARAAAGLLPLLPDAEAPTVCSSTARTPRAAGPVPRRGDLAAAGGLKRAGARGLMVLPVEGMLA